MNAITKKFTNQIRGYDKSQVDSYIQKLTYEYGKLQEQYMELSGQHELLQKKANTGMGMIAKVLVDAERNAVGIIADAKNEAARVVGNAHVEFEKLQQDKAIVVAEINEMADKLREMIPAV